RVLGRGRDAKLALPHTALGRTCGAHARRPGGYRHPRDRREGLHRSGHTPSRRTSVRARGRRIRRVDGDHPPARRLAEAVPHLVGDVHHGLARGADSCRDRCPLGFGGRQRRAARRSRDALPLPGVRMSKTALTDQELLEAADAVAARAYAPYSNFDVGCAVLTRDGRVIEGVNVENAAYPLGVCAERTAFARAIGDGYRPGDFTVAAITASPCGGCRQWLVAVKVERGVFRNDDGARTMTPGPP